MNLNKVLTLFAPKDRIFYALFAKDAENLLLATRTLKELFTTAGNGRREALIEEIRQLERTGGDLTQEIFNQLSINFITPFDREDIHELTRAMYDVIDLIQAAAMRLDISRITEVTKPMMDLADLIEAGVIKVQLAINELKGLDYKKISAILKEIHQIEEQADEVFDNAIRALFDKEKDPIMLVKNQQVLEMLENATDRCDEVAKVINAIILKYA